MMNVFKQLCLFMVISLVIVRYNDAAGRCYDSNNEPTPCMPRSVNPAFNLPVDATNTCGNPRIRYCRAFTGAKRCAYCDVNNPALAHPSRYLTDFNSNAEQTWWQSETMYEGIQNQNVNLTLRLGKSFDIMSVRIKFYSPRPESFAIYKKTSEDGDWVPYQYYSQSCTATYNQPTDGFVTRDDQAMCTADFSDISPLTGGSVAFSTLMGRPSAFAFDKSKVLQDWVTATSIRVMLTRLNTFGDEALGDKSVLQSYFYGISDISILGRCKCNGHADECEDSAGQGGSGRLVCQCKHNTQGPDCDECLPFYNDRPWARATSDTANACMPCDCKGLSKQCFFDKDLFAKTGRGGHCINCKENTDGANCELCKPNFYKQQSDKKCVACNCDPTGSANLQCDDNGRCECKGRGTGDKCDQ